MDTQTRHALKGDKFAQATKTSVTWLSGHRSNVMRWAIGAAVVLFWASDCRFSGPCRKARQKRPWARRWISIPRRWHCPALRRRRATYATVADRVKGRQSAVQGGCGQVRLADGRLKARYFTGITEQELGQTAAAESDLKKVADSWNRNLANLAKVALASIYHQTGRDQQAIDLYNEIIAKPSDTVTAGTGAA